MGDMGEAGVVAGADEADVAKDVDEAGVSEGAEVTMAGSASSVSTCCLLWKPPIRKKVMMRERARTTIKRTMPLYLARADDCDVSSFLL